MTIEELYNVENLSARAYNVCNYNDLKKLSDVLSHYYLYKTFDNLRNCGKKSNEELKTLCLKYLDYENEKLNKSLKTENKNLPTIANFTRTQREIVNSFIEINVNYLSNRSKNAITSILNGNLKIQNFRDKILTNENFNFQSIANVGAKTVEELNILIESIIELIEKVAKINNEHELIALKNKIFIEKTFPIAPLPAETHVLLSIFSLVQFLITNRVIFEKNENIIFLRAFKIYKNQPNSSLDKIAAEAGVSRERIRQIRKSIIENIFLRFQFVRDIHDDLYQKYNIDFNQQFIYVSDDLNNLINQVNETNFTSEFNTVIVHAFLSNRYDIVGRIDDVLLPKSFNSKDRHNWNNFYLIAKSLNNKFDFNKFAADIKRRMNDRIDETYNFQFTSYLTEFALIKDTLFISSIFPVAEKIINHEFELTIDLNDNIVFKRNTIKPIFEYVIETLEKLGAPSKIDEIFNLISQDYPEITKSADTLRASLTRTSEIIYFGRSSTYGLKKWETEKVGIKGGTIRSIALDFLANLSDPQHISTISDYILKFRPDSNLKSIYYNLKIDESNTFLFFINSYVGLTFKNYDKSHIQVSHENASEGTTWEERYAILNKFLNQNLRFPYSSGCPESEIKIYRWYKIQLAKYMRGELDEAKSTLFNKIMNQHKHNRTRKRRTNLTNKYNELISFVINQNRLPLANNTEENDLYHFFFKQNKLFELGILTQTEENKFIEIAQIIQNQNHENK